MLIILSVIRIILHAVNYIHIAIDDYLYNHMPVFISYTFTYAPSLCHEIYDYSHTYTHTRTIRLIN